MICKIAELLKVGMYREDTEDTFCSVLRMNHSDSQLRSEEYIIVTLKWLRPSSNIVRQGLHGWRGEPNNATSCRAKLKLPNQTTET